MKVDHGGHKGKDKRQMPHRSRSDTTLNKTTASLRHNGPFPDENLIFRPEKTSTNSFVVRWVAAEAVCSNVIPAMDGTKEESVRL